MGASERFALVDGRWVTVESEAPVRAPLVIDIHDSDIATIDFGIAADHPQGRFYLGYEPRIYFDDATQNDPVDRPAQAASFANWARAVLGVEVPAESVEELIASNHADDEPEADFVEDTVERLIGLLQLPLPEALQSEA